jgi:hypothetical protein
MTSFIRNQEIAFLAVPPDRAEGRATTAGAKESPVAPSVALDTSGAATEGGSTAPAVAAVSVSAAASVGDFAARYEWQAVLPGQSVPAGLEVRLDISAGLGTGQTDLTSSGGGGGGGGGEASAGYAHLGPRCARIPPVWRLKVWVDAAGWGQGIPQVDNSAAMSGGDDDSDDDDSEAEGVMEVARGPRRGLLVVPLPGGGSGYYHRMDVTQATTVGDIAAAIVAAAPPPPRPPLSAVLLLDSPWSASAPSSGAVALSACLGPAETMGAAMFLSQARLRAFAVAGTRPDFA